MQIVQCKNQPVPKMIDDKNNRSIKTGAPGIFTTLLSCFSMASAFVNRERLIYGTFRGDAAMNSALLGIPELHTEVTIPKKVYSEKEVHEIWEDCREIECVFTKVLQFQRCRFVARFGKRTCFSMPRHDGSYFNDFLFLLQLVLNN